MALRLQEYSFTPIYIKGESNIVDFFSRPPSETKINHIKSETLTKAEKNKIMTEFHLASGQGLTNNMKFLIKNKFNWENYSQILRILYLNARPVLN